MVVYIACCKTLDEARAIHDKLLSTNPTIVFSRILRHERELDAYDSEAFASSAEQASIGQLAFGHGFQSVSDIWRRLLRQLIAIAGGVFVALLLFHRFLGGPSRSFPALGTFAGTIFVGLALVVAAGAKAIAKMTPDRTALVRAANCLRHGKPVVIAGSDNPPDSSDSLPENVIFFEQCGESLRRSA